MEIKTKYDVFISHKTAEDGDIARRLAASLESHGLKCWIAPRDIPAGQNYASAIVDGIRRSSVFLLLFSRYANQSDDIVRECQQASRLKRPLLTVRLDDTEFCPALSYFLALPQGVGPFARNENLFDGVFEHVRAMLDGSETPVPMLVPPKPKTRLPTAIAVAIVALGAAAACLWHGQSRPKQFPSTRTEEQTVNEVLRVVSSLTTVYQGATEARTDFIDDAINSLDDPSVAASGALLFKKQMRDAIDKLESSRPSEEAIARMTDTPIDAAVYRALFDASRQEFENALEELPVVIPAWTRRDNPMSPKDRKTCLQQKRKWVELESRFFALGVIELLHPISSSATSEFRKHAATYTAIPRLSMPWPDDKEQLDIEQEAVVQQLQDLTIQLAAVVGKQNMECSGMRKDFERLLYDAGTTSNQVSDIIGDIMTDAAEKTEQTWKQGQSD